MRHPDEAAASPDHVDVARAGRIAQGRVACRVDAEAATSREAELRDDPQLVDIDRLARHYIGGQYPSRQRNRISAWIEIDRWHGWGAAENTDIVHH
ncbi:MAG: hypothetical protein ACRDT0_24270 [Pseudonocardiaceae bacterium]